MKSVIYEFDPVIYPTRLWVCKKPETEDVAELFYPFNTDGEQIDSFGNTLEYDGGRYAATMIVGNKKSRIRGCLYLSLSRENAALAYLLTRLCII